MMEAECTPSVQEVHHVCCHVWGMWEGGLDHLALRVLARVSWKWRSVKDNIAAFVRAVLRWGG